MKTIKIDTMTIVRGTTTPADGYALFMVLDKEIKQGNKVQLSMLNCTPFSSSFLNSSFAPLFEEYGRGLFEYLTLVNYQPKQAAMLKDYFETLANLKNRYHA